MDNRSNSFLLPGGVSWQSVAVGTGVGVAATLIFMLVSAFLMVSVDLAEGASAVMASVSISIGALIGGFVAAKYNKHGGLFCGLFSGAGMFLFFAALALIMGSAIGFNLLVRLVLCAFFGAVGGILGINLQRKRKYV